MQVTRNYKIETCNKCKGYCIELTTKDACLSQQPCTRCSGKGVVKLKLNEQQTTWFQWGSKHYNTVYKDISYSEV